MQVWEVEDAGLDVLARVLQSMQLMIQICHAFGDNGGFCPLPQVQSQPARIAATGARSCLSMPPGCDIRVEGSALGLGLSLIRRYWCVDLTVQTGAHVLLHHMQ